MFNLFRQIADVFYTSPHRDIDRCKQGVRKMMAVVDKQRATLVAYKAAILKVQNDKFTCERHACTELVLYRAAFCPRCGHPHTRKQRDEEVYKRMADKLIRNVEEVKIAQTKVADLELHLVAV